MTSFLNTIPNRKKSPDQLVTSAKRSLFVLTERNDLVVEDKLNSANENLNKCCSDIRGFLPQSGSSDSGDYNDDKIREVSRCAQLEDFYTLLISNIDLISFEARKDATAVFNFLVRKNVENFGNYYLANNTNMLELLMDGYTKVEGAISCGSMLRECIRHERLAYLLLRIDRFWRFFDTYLHVPNFEIASDAFNTLRDLLTTPKHKHVSSDFLADNCDKVLKKYDVLLVSDNYVTRRRSLKMLSELLLDRDNFAVMMHYISSKHNLKTIMNLLRHKSSQIQFEAFHVFKIFVANPNKSNEVEHILWKNRAKLISYLEVFHLDKDDPQFVDEKRLLIDTLQQMIEPEGSTFNCTDAEGGNSDSKPSTPRGGQAHVALSNNIITSERERQLEQRLRGRTPSYHSWGDACASAKSRTSGSINATSNGGTGKNSDNSDTVATITALDGDACQVDIQHDTMASSPLPSSSPPLPCDERVVPTTLTPFAAAESLGTVTGNSQNNLTEDSGKSVHATDKESGCIDDVQVSLETLVISKNATDSEFQQHVQSKTATIGQQEHDRCS